MKQRLLKVLVGLLFIASLPITIFIHLVVYIITGRAIIIEIIEWILE
jgi:hypothetical protein